MVDGNQAADMTSGRGDFETLLPAMGTNATSGPALGVAAVNAFSEKVSITCTTADQLAAQFAAVLMPAFHGSLSVRCFLFQQYLSLDLQAGARVF